MALLEAKDIFKLCWFWGVFFLFKLRSICVRHLSAQFPKMNQAFVVVTEAHRGVD